jgi:hypothetical protein
MRRRMLLWVMVLCSVAGAATGVAQDLDGFDGVDAFNLMPDPGCVLSQAWAGQGNPRTDIAGIRNHALPDWNATYWGTRCKRIFRAPSSRFVDGSQRHDIFLSRSITA